MIVSHEQSSREREFSVNNKEIQQENLKKKTFSERLIYNLNADSIEVYELLITPALKKVVVPRRYKEFLDETRNLSQQNEREKKKVDISRERRNKEVKGNITKYNQLVREGYYEIQH